MGQLKSLIPTPKAGGKSAPGVTVSGTIVRFPSAIVAQIGADNHMNFAIGGDNDDRLYIQTKTGAAEFKLLGKSGGRRYVNDPGLVKAAKLQNDTYPLLYDEQLKAHYISFDPNAEWKAPEPKKRPARTPEQIAKAKEKYLAKKAAKDAGQTGTASEAAESTGGKRGNRPR